MNIQQYLESNDVPFETIEHAPTYDAQRMAQAVHVRGREVAKTVLLRADGDYKYVVAVLPATRQVDLKLASRTLGGAHVELATEIEVAEHCPECEVGALPPFGSQYDMETIVDESLAAEEMIVFEGNTHHEAIRMKYADFGRLETPLVAAISRPARPVGVPQHRDES